MQKDINVKGLNEDILLDMNERRRIIHVIDSVYSSFDSCSLLQVLWIKGFIFVVVVSEIGLGSLDWDLTLPLKKVNQKSETNHWSLMYRVLQLGCRLVKGTASVPRSVFKIDNNFIYAGAVEPKSGCWLMLKGDLSVGASGPAEIFRSKTIPWEKRTKLPVSAFKGPKHKNNIATIGWFQV